MDNSKIGIIGNSSMGKAIAQLLTERGVVVAIGDEITKSEIDELNLDLEVIPLSHIIKIPEKEKIFILEKLPEIDIPFIPLLNHKKTYTNFIDGKPIKRGVKHKRKK